MSDPAPHEASLVAAGSPIRWWRRLVRSEYLVLWLCVAYIAALTPFTPGFGSLANAENVLLTLLPLFLVAVGETVVLISGGIDLSVTATIGLTSVIGARIASADGGWLAGSPLATPVAVVAMLAVGAAIGWGNGLAVVCLRMPAFLVTLTSLMGFSGLALVVTHSRNIGNLPHGFSLLGGSVFVATGITAAAGLLVAATLQCTLFGRWLYALGHNARAAAISGVPVRAVNVAAYVVCGACAALGSVLYTGQAETGSPVLGQRVLLDVIGATVLGGTSLFGGRGRVLWTLCGVLFLTLVDNSLNLLNLSLFAITMVKGAVILGAALLDALRHRGAAGQ